MIREFTPAVAGAVGDAERLRHLIVVEDGSGAGELPSGTLDARELLALLGVVELLVRRSRPEPPSTKSCPMRSETSTSRT